VYRVRVPDGHVVTSWKLKEKPGGLSITRASNVLVTSWGSSQLNEYTPDGVLVRTMPLQSDIDKPWHAVQVIGGTEEQFVFCRSVQLCMFL